MIQSASTQRTLSSAVNNYRQRKPSISSFRNQRNVSSSNPKNKRIFSFRETSAKTRGTTEQYRRPGSELKNEKNEIKRIKEFQNKVNDLHSEYGENAFMTLYEAKEELLEQGEKLRDRIK